MIQTLLKKRIYYPNQTVSYKSTDLYFAPYHLSHPNYRERL
jgi:hypothetical protein